MKQRIIDLTHPLVEGMPQYPGQDDARFCRRLDIDTDGVLMTSLCCCTHIGTHVDAPAHFIRGGLTMFEIPLDRWMGSALVLDVEPDANGAVGPEPFTAALCDTRAVLNGLLIRSGHSKCWGQPDYYGAAPFLAPATATVLAQSGLSFVGMDIPSPDPVGAAHQPSHQILLGAGVGIIENLTNLDQLGRGEVWFCAAPLVIGEGDGAPCRAFVINSASG